MVFLFLRSVQDENKSTYMVEKHFHDAALK